VVRLVLRVPLSARQERVAALLADGLELDAIAKHLGCARSTVDFHVERAARKIPSDLPRAARLILWWRGASFEVLNPAPGAPLRKVLAESTPAPQRVNSRARTPTRTEVRK
jgi:ATP-dependent DNA ligase